MENCSRVKAKITMEEDDVRELWKGYFEDLYILGIEEQIIVSICSFKGARMHNCFRREPVNKDEEKARVTKLIMVEEEVRMRLQEKR